MNSTTFESTSFYDNKAFLKFEKSFADSNVFRSDFSLRDNLLNEKSHLSFVDESISKVGANRWSFPQAATTGEDSCAVEIPHAFSVLAKWVALVDFVDQEKGSFTAILKSQNNPDEIGEFDMDDVSNDDKPLVVPGATFYWNVGQSIEKSGRKMNASIIRFKRARYWSRLEVEAAREEAKKYNVWLPKKDASENKTF